MSELKAVYYGQVQLIPGIVCDGYVLDDQTAVMSERGTADLLDLDHKALKNMGTNWPPKTLASFIDNDLNMATDLVEVTANSHYKGRQIIVYTSEIIESLIRCYALALAHDKLRQNQVHIGKRCVILQSALVRTALDAAIKEACGFIPDIQNTARQHYLDAVALLQEFGFSGSIVAGDNERLATKKDIAEFLKIPTTTLSSFLHKHRDDIRPVSLERATIRTLGSKAKQLNGYRLNDVAKVSLAMDTETGIELKKRLFGQVGLFATPTTRDEIQWRQAFAKIFAGLGLRYNYQIGNYRVDFFVTAMDLCLECNGYEHRYYDPQAEADREKAISKKYGLVRFHHKIGLETLFNGILQAKPGKVVKLYDLQQLREVEAVAKEAKT